MSKLSFFFCLSLIAFGLSACSWGTRADYPGQEQASSTVPLTVSPQGDLDDPSICVGAACQCEVE